MFITVNDRPLNAYTILYFYKREETHDNVISYNICYRLTDGRIITEEFDNESDRDEKCQLVNDLTVGNSKEIEEEIAEIQDDIAHLKEVGFHPLKVDELPTEDIKDYILYLVPSDDPEEDNLCYEYLYINNNWEMVGTTSVDLTDYYTKSETDTEIITKIKERPPVYSTGETLFVLQGKKSGVYNITANSDTVRLQVTPNSSSWVVNLKDKTLYVVKEFNSTSELATGTMLLHYFEYNGNTLRKAKVSYDPVYMPGRLCQIFYDNVATLAFQSDLNNYLSKDNTTSYTPTADYHPSTKKYVDDKVAVPVITLSISQVVSQDPLTLNMTSEQQALLEDDGICDLLVDGSALGVQSMFGQKNNNGDTLISFTGFNLQYITSQSETVINSTSCLVGIYSKQSKQLKIVLTPLSNVDAPTEPQHLVNKSYVDNAIQGFKFFNGTEEDWNEYTTEQKAAFILAVVEDGLILTQEDIQALNNIEGEENTYDIDLSESEALEGFLEIAGVQE